MKNKYENQRGITFLEISLAIILVVISLGFSLLYNQTSQVRADLNSQTAQLVSYLRLGHSNAASGLNGEFHNIHFETSSYTLYTTSPYNPEDSSNFTIQLPETIEIQNINLNGSAADLAFDSPYGETKNYGSIDLVSTQINQTKTIYISEFGTINY